MKLVKYLVGFIEKGGEDAIISGLCLDLADFTLLRVQRMAFTLTLTFK
jgi:hypothetical protein